MRKYLAALALPLALAACGGDAKPEADPTPVESTSAPATTAAQWASVVAGADLQTKIDKALDSCGPGLAYADDPMCSTYLMTVNYTSVTLVSELDSLEREKGEPPAELVDLVSETRDAAKALNGASASKASPDLFRALTAYPGARWDPYM